MHDSREEREDDDADDDGEEVAIDIRNHAAEEKSCEWHTDPPEETADDVVSRELAICHGADAGDNRNKCPDDRHESCEDHRLATMLDEELLSAFQISSMEEERFFPLKKFPTDAVSEPVADGISRDCSDERDDRQWNDVKDPLRSQETRGKEETVARQEEPDEEPRLSKDDSGNAGIPDERKEFDEGGHT